MKTVVLAFTLALLSSAGLAQEIDETASEEEMSQIGEAIAQFNCEVPDEVEKESPSLYELDDAICEGGQYDIKLDGEMTVVSMTYDGPIDE